MAKDKEKIEERELKIVEEANEASEKVVSAAGSLQPRRSRQTNLRKRPFRKHSQLLAKRNKPLDILGLLHVMFMFTFVGL
jgi:hypothetical protein